jgi:hypothetical protein
MNFDKQDRECLAPSCRDKGWMRGWEGALCLSCWTDDSSGGGEVRGSYPPEDRHKAPTSAPPFPCPYSEESSWCPLLPVLVVNIHTRRCGHKCAAYDI